jgi:hypothetical protein
MFLAALLASLFNAQHIDGLPKALGRQHGDIITTTIDRQLFYGQPQAHQGDARVTTTIKKTR